MPILQHLFQACRLYLLRRKEPCLVMSEENFAEKDSFINEGKGTNIEFMFVCQVVYILLNYVAYLYYVGYYTVFISWGFKSILGMSSYFGFIYTLIAVITLIVYPIISILSFCFFTWAYMTGNLQKLKVCFICNLPFIVICIFIILMIIHG